MSIKVYSSPNCMWCVKLKEYLNEQGVSYDEVDISKNRDAAKNLFRATGQMAVPVTEVKGQYIVGFDRDALSKAIRS